jgi:hypothetical protein
MLFRSVVLGYGQNSRHQLPSTPAQVPLLGYGMNSRHQ